MFPHLSNLHKNKLDIEEFKECLQKAWASFPQDKIRSLVESVPRRVEACRRARVGIPDINPGFRRFKKGIYFLYYVAFA
jgi:hypothetical protein